MKLSLRLSEAVKLVPKCHVAADIGTDHGFLAIELIKNNIADKVLAMDINEGPLTRAFSHIHKENLTDRIECRLSDGLDKLGKYEADSIIIAGMGGELIVKILERDNDKINTGTSLILVPHSHSWDVREYLYSNGFSTDTDYMICDKDKYYHVIRAVKCSDSGDSSELNEVERFFGRKPLKEYLLKEIEKYKDIPQKESYLVLVRGALEMIELAIRSRTDDRGSERT